MEITGYVREGVDGEVGVTGELAVDFADFVIEKMILRSRRRKYSRDGGVRSPGV